MAKTYVTGETVPEHGVYFVQHAKHRLIRSVRLFAGDRFPRCSQCGDAVTFELLMGVLHSPAAEVIPFHELPLRRDEEEESAEKA